MVNSDPDSAQAGASRSVAAVLEQLQHAHGFAVLDSVSISRGSSEGTAEATLEHVVIDRCGVLVVETLAFDRAVLQGISSEPNWTAVFADGRTETFANPLVALDGRLMLLNQALRDAGTFLARDALRGLVVVVGADVDRVKADVAAPARIIGIGELPAAYSARGECVVSEPLDPDGQVALGVTVAGLDALKRASAASEVRAAPPAPTALPETAIAPKAPGSPPARAAVISPAVSGADERSRLWRIVLIAAVLLVVASTGVCGMVVLGARLYDSRSSVGTSNVPGEQPPTQQDAGSPEATVKPEPPMPDEERLPTVELARAALKKREPGIYRLVENPDEPDVGDRDGYAAFTWEYVAKSSSSMVSVRSVTVLLDENGRLVRIIRE